MRRRSAGEGRLYQFLQVANRIRRFEAQHLAATAVVHIRDTELDARAVAPACRSNQLGFGVRSCCSRIGFGRHQRRQSTLPFALRNSPTALSTPLQQCACPRLLSKPDRGQKPAHKQGTGPRITPQLWLKHGEGELKGDNRSIYPLSMMPGARCLAKPPGASTWQWASTHADQSDWAMHFRFPIFYFREPVVLPVLQQFELFSRILIFDFRFFEFRFPK